jgi:hypothetical protein
MQQHTQTHRHPLATSVLNQKPTQPSVSRQRQRQRQLMHPEISNPRHPTETETETGTWKHGRIFYFQYLMLCAQCQLPIANCQCPQCRHCCCCGMWMIDNAKNWHWAMRNGNGLGCFLLLHMKIEPNKHGPWLVDGLLRYQTPDATTPTPPLVFPLF